ncbi:MAG: gliding motility-associated C-terminal domain-containing protein, partial [Flavobacteriales bacterium]|nr:gliding motility-associated C-terminal domain-containing protein [Flavobacteriales bacterium]
LTGNCIIKNTTIYNRWGQVLFISELPDPIWDGRNLSGELVPEGTYYCVVENETGTQSSFVHLTR